MDISGKAYQWSSKDKLLYFLSMIPFAIFFIGTAYLLYTHSIYLTIIFLAMYLAINVFQAGCCVGCPYQGKYCPALCGVYLGNLLSGILYKKRKHSEEFFQLNAKIAEIILFVFVLFPIYWIFQTGPKLIPLYFALIIVHFIMFMPTQCEKCGYNDTCPGGQFWKKCRSQLKRS